MHTNYVLIDYENVQPATLAGLDAEQFKVLLFVGANQAKLPFDVVSAMQLLGTRGEYIKIAGNGPNALDFHIAYYIGQLAAQDPNGSFHIISKDTGFDPLIQHLKAGKVTVTRSKTIADILPKAAKAKPVPEKVAVVLKNLKQRAASKPRTTKTLSSTIRSLFQNKLGDAELASLLAELKTRGFIVVSGTKVSYALPEGDA